MGYKSDHDFRTGLFKQVTKGMEDDQPQEFHQFLHDYYSEQKDSMTYQELLKAAKEFMENYPEYTWNGDRWVFQE